MDVHTNIQMDKEIIKKKINIAKALEALDVNKLHKKKV